VLSDQVKSGYQQLRVHLEKPSAFKELTTPKSAFLVSLLLFVQLRSA